MDPSKRRCEGGGGGRRRRLATPAGRWGWSRVSPSRASYSPAAPAPRARPDDGSRRRITQEDRTEPPVGVDQALEPDGPSGWSCAGCESGQTFVPAAATITGVDLTTHWAVVSDTVTQRRVL